MLSIVPTWVVIVLNFRTYKSIFGYFLFVVVVSLYCERVKAAFRSALSSGRICLFVSDSFSEWVVYCFNLVTGREVQISSAKEVCPCSSLHWSVCLSAMIVHILPSIHQYLLVSVLLLNWNCNFLCSSGLFLNWQLLFKSHRLCSRLTPVHIWSWWLSHWG